MLTLQIKEKEIENLTPEEEFVRGTVGAKCQINFDEFWQSYNKYIVFKRVGYEPINFMVDTLENEIEIPYTILAESGEFKIGVFGTTETETLPTLYSKDIKILYGTDTHGTTPPTYIPSEIDQLRLSKQDKLTAGNGIKIENNVISSSGTIDYEPLENKPQINGVELLGNKSLTDLGIDIPTKTSELENDSGFIDDTAFENYYTKTEVDEKTVVDQTYNKNSQNAQSGIAVAEAVAQSNNFFDITNDGMINLKPQYRGKGSPTFNVSVMDKTFAISDNGDGVNGSLNHLLPKKLVIPTTVNGITVTSVAQGMFCRNEAIECIEWNENIKNIPIGCFAQAIKLKNIKNLSKVEFVGNSAFIYVPIEFLDFPSLKSIEERAFRYMPLVESINIGNVTTLFRQTFCNCSRLARVVGGQGITEIPRACFSWTPALRSIPNWNITNIGDYGFKYSGISLDWETLKNNGCTFGKWATPLQCLPNVNIDSITVSKSAVNKLTVSLNQNFEYWANELIGENSLQPTKTFSEGCVFFAMMNIYCSLNNIVDMRSAFELQRMCNDLGAMSSFTGEAPYIPNFAKALNLNYEPYFAVDNNSVQLMVNALSERKYILFFVPASTSSATGHVVVGYGVDKDTQEIYLHDSSLNSILLFDTTIREGTNYRMPITNILQSVDRVSTIPYFVIIG